MFELNFPLEPGESRINHEQDAVTRARLKSAVGRKIRRRMGDEIWKTKKRNEVGLGRFVFLAS